MVALCLSHQFQRLQLRYGANGEREEVLPIRAMAKLLGWWAGVGWGGRMVGWGGVEWSGRWGGVGWGGVGWGGVGG